MKMREAMEAIWKEVYFYAIEEDKQDFAHLQEVMLEDPPEYKDLRNSFLAIAHLVDAALSEPPRKGRWENGNRLEYEYAYCSECGRAQWAGWDTHKQAEENIESFANDYKFCPGCGAEMEGGVYVN